MEEQHLQGHGNNSSTMAPAETQDRNLIDFMAKEEEQNQCDVTMTDHPTDIKEKHTLLEELHRTHSHSSSSSDEEVEVRGESKKRKKKGLKDGIKQNIAGEKEEECAKHDTDTPMENCIEVENVEATNPEGKKGFLENIKEKLPGQHKKTEGGASTPFADHEDSPGGEAQDKKGILDKIKEKLPGHHKNEHEPKEKEN